MKTIPKLFFLGVAAVTFLAGTAFLLVAAVYRCLLFLASSLRNVQGYAPCSVLIPRECERDFIADNARGFEMNAENSLTGQKLGYTAQSTAMSECSPRLHD